MKRVAIIASAGERGVEALLVVGDRIAAVGSEAAVRAASNRGIREVDLMGRALLPGFIDAHGHFPGAGIFEVYADLNSPPIGHIEDLGDLAAQLGHTAGDPGLRLPPVPLQRLPPETGSSGWATTTRCWRRGVIRPASISIGCPPHIPSSSGTCPATWRC